MVAARRSGAGGSAASSSRCSHILRVALGLALVATSSSVRSFEGWQTNGRVDLREQAIHTARDGARGLKISSLDRLLIGLHHVTLTQKLRGLGIDPMAGQTTSDLEAMSSAASSEELVGAGMHDTLKDWEIVNDGDRPPYYRHRTTGVAQWVPGKWRRNRQSRSTSRADIKANQMLWLDSAQASATQETIHPMMDVLADMHGQRRALVAPRRGFNKPTADLPSLSYMLALVTGAAAAAALSVCLAVGTLKAEDEQQQPPAAGPPDALLCPISLELMVDPVMLAETGQTYDRATIKSWLYTHATDPITNVELRSKKLVPNIAIRKLAQATNDPDPPSAGPPDLLLCPISLELMFDPVTLAETGQTYDRASIASWLYTHATDPITNVELRSKKLVPNIAIRKLVLAWQAEHPEQQAEAAVEPAPHRPTSRSALIAAIGGGMRKGMSRSESADRLLELFSSSPRASSGSSGGFGSSGGMPVRKAQSYTDLVGLRTSQAAPVR
jgi:hypothetical protein